MNQPVLKVYGIELEQVSLTCRLMSLIQLFRPFVVDEEDYMVQEELGFQFPDGVEQRCRMMMS